MYIQEEHNSKAVENIFNFYLRHQRCTYQACMVFSIILDMSALLTHKLLYAFWAAWRQTAVRLLEARF